MDMSLVYSYSFILRSGDFPSLTMTCQVLNREIKTCIFKDMEHSRRGGGRGYIQYSSQTKYLNVISFM